MAPTENLLELQTLRPLPRPMQWESVFVIMSPGGSRAQSCLRGTSINCPSVQSQFPYSLPGPWSKAGNYHSSEWPKRILTVADKSALARGFRSPLRGKGRRDLRSPLGNQNSFRCLGKKEEMSFFFFLFFLISDDYGSFVSFCLLCFGFSFVKPEPPIYIRFT